jgi:hypothetical protein
VYAKFLKVAVCVWYIQLPLGYDLLNPPDTLLNVLSVYF